MNRARSVVVRSERHVAFPGICKTRSGALLVVYREGYAHASGNPDDGRIMLTRSCDGGRSWEEPVVAYDDPEFDDRNAAISCMRDGTVVLIWDKYLHGKHHWAWLSTSQDEGRSWSPAIRVSDTQDVHTRSPAIDLGNGKWLIPYSESTDSPTVATFFSHFDPASHAFDEVAVTPRGQRNIADEVCVTRAPNGDLVALIRSNTDPVLFQIVSHDDGRTWSPPWMTTIPSQFTPADLITLENGWLLCGFSFRERRNERLVVSRDNGVSWDVENSADLFVATPSVSDRSYPALVQLDPQTVGAVLYETAPAPEGGAIYFVTAPLSALSAPKQPVLYQGDLNADPAVALFPETVAGTPVEVAYRFTGRFGPPPNAAGLLLEYKDAQNYTALEFQMGTSADRQSLPTNYVQLVRCVAGQREVVQGQEAREGQYDTGNMHRLGARQEGDEWVMLLDGNAQLRVPLSLGRPCGFLVRRAAVALYEASWLEAPEKPSPKAR